MKKRSTKKSGAQKKKATPKQKPVKNKGLNGVFFFKLVSYFIISLVAVSLVLVSYLLLYYPTKTFSFQQEDVEIIINEGESFESVAKLLEEKKVIESAFVFEIFMRLRGADENLRNGVIQLEPPLTYEEVARRISYNMGSLVHRVTIPEGYNRFEIAKRLERMGICSAQNFIQISENQALLEKYHIQSDSFEGFLFPDTYAIREHTPCDEVLVKLADNFEKRWEKISAKHEEKINELQKDFGFGKKEIVTLASIVEEEAKRENERAMIAGLFLNRLSSSDFRPLHRLQADPTISYGCLSYKDQIASCANFNGKITHAMLNDSNNPYNTYRHGGLTPGPITNPGSNSIEAVINFAKHDYIYFVAKGDGSHHFSVTLEEHNQAVRKYLH